MTGNVSRFPWTPTTSGEPVSSPDYVSPYLNQEPQPVPPLPFVVKDVDGYIWVARRDGKHYRPFEAMGVNPEEFRAKCEWLCELLNDAHDYGAMEQIRRARAVDHSSADAFLGDALVDLALNMTEAADAMADLTKTIKQAAE
jgi:hypothetical protein